MSVKNGLRKSLPPILLNWLDIPVLSDCEMYLVPEGLDKYQLCFRGRRFYTWEAIFFSAVLAFPYLKYLNKVLIVKRMLMEV
jgi:hypothetical protein